MFTVFLVNTYFVLGVWKNKKNTQVKKKSKITTSILGSSLFEN